ncbi:hypothetical protein ACS0TY_009690 [Phlomoides rotata]
MEVVNKNRKGPHVLAVGVPAQGHVKPLMKLCRQIAKQGIKVTFVNLQSIHDKIVAAAAEEVEEGNLILTPIPDTRSPEEQSDSFNMEPFKRTLPASLMDLIHRINGADPDEKITCVIADLTFEWILDIAPKMGAEPFGFSSPSAASMAMVFHLPKLLQDGILDPIGNIKKGEIVSLSDDIPAWGEDEFGWSFPSNPRAQEMFVAAGGQRIYQEKINKCKWVLCNTCYELEPSGCNLNPNFLPIGPLLDATKSHPGSGNFYPEDASCLAWLDTKPPGSVIYVSFGSVAVLTQVQLDELALGLELSGRDFLWVVRPDFANGSRAVYPDGFLERVSGNGMIVGWAPQERVLSHPSVACFLSHCGWNSTLEGLSIGVPFLCWPYFADQFHNQKYICDKWKTGLRISPDKNGIRSRHEIKKKIDMLFYNDDLKANALVMKETCAESLNEGGSSFKNLKTFVDHIRNSALLCL